MGEKIRQLIRRIVLWACPELTRLRAPEDPVQGGHRHGATRLHAPGAHVWALVALAAGTLCAPIVRAQNGAQTSGPVASGIYTGTITTTAGSNVEIPVTGMGCVGVSITGSWGGSALQALQSNDGNSFFAVDTFLQANGSWTESFGQNGKYYVGISGAQYFKVLGPVGSGSANLTLVTSPAACNSYGFSIPAVQAGNGFFGGAVSATTTQTTVPDTAAGYQSADVFAYWNGITGTPSSCTIQMFESSNGVNYIAGPSVPVQPGTNSVFEFYGPWGLAVEFQFACSGAYPSAGTLTLAIVYKPQPGLTYVASGAGGGLQTKPVACDKYKPISINSATTTLLITGQTGENVKICSLHLFPSVATTAALIEGTGATCGTGTTGMSGSTTAASGWNLALTGSGTGQAGGIQLGDGVGVIMQTQTGGDSVCLVSGNTAVLSGGIMYAIL